MTLVESIIKRCYLVMSRTRYLMVQSKTFKQYYEEQSGGSYTTDGYVTGG